MPTATYAIRQPNAVMKNSASAGSVSVPSPTPQVAMPSASPRSLSNQAVIDLEKTIGPRQAPKPDAQATMRKIAQKALALNSEKLHSASA